MAEFLVTTGIKSEVDNIIIDADKHIVIVSPYLKFTDNYAERLQHAANRGVKIVLVYGKNELSREAKVVLGRIKNLQAFYYENLHAKCYYNEDKMVLTSMNLYNSSHGDNREMGISLKATEDAKLYSKAIREVDSIISAAKNETELFLTKEKTKVVIAEPKKRSYSGICIRCSGDIPLNADAPFCSNCYKSWQKFGNPFYEEKYCHKCGKPEDTSMEKPLCYSCYSK